MVAERYKHHLNAGRVPNLYFYRDSNGAEVDLLDMTDASASLMYEAKSSRTSRKNFLRHLDSAGELLHVEPDSRSVIMRSDSTAEVNGSTIWTVADWACE